MTKRESSLARKTKTGAMSDSGSPSRPIGRPSMARRKAPGSRAAQSWPRLVAAAGAMQLTVMPSGPHSRAAVRDSATMPALAAP